MFASSLVPLLVALSMFCFIVARHVRRNVERQEQRVHVYAFDRSRKERKEECRRYNARYLKK